MSVSGRNCVASESAAADSTDGDDKEKIKAEAEADLLENVFIYLTEEDTKKKCLQTRRE